MRESVVAAAPRGTTSFKPWMRRRAGPEPPAEASRQAASQRMPKVRMPSMVLRGSSSFTAMTAQAFRALYQQAASVRGAEGFFEIHGGAEGLGAASPGSGEGGRAPEP